MTKKTQADELLRALEVKRAGSYQDIGSSRIGSVVRVLSHNVLEAIMHSLAGSKSPTSLKNSLEDGVYSHRGNVRPESVVAFQPSLSVNSSFGYDAAGWLLKAEDVRE